MLAENRQMIPLDPPFADSATVGGVVAANSSGPRRRLYGTARDMVIGMKFATLEGKLVQSGGMVVKNVAGLDMAKLHDRLLRHAGRHRGGEFQAAAAAGNGAHAFCSPSTRSPTPSRARDRLLGERAPARGHRSAEPRRRRRRRRTRGYVLAVQAGGNAAAVAPLPARTVSTAIGWRSRARAGERFWRHVAGFHAAFPGGQSAMAPWCALPVP